MPIKVACQCGQKFAAKDELAGKKVKCPKCGEPITIPGAQAQPAGAQQQQRASQPAPKPAAKDDLLGGNWGSGGQQAVSDPILADILAEAGIASDPNYTGPRCPGCNAPIAADAVLCVKCGFNVRTGQRIKAQIGPSSEFAHLTGSANAEELIAKAEQEIRETPIETKESDYGDMLTAFLLAGGMGFAAIIIVGLTYLLFRYIDISATSMTGIAVIMFMFGIPMATIGRIWLIVAAFLDSTVEGILVLLIDCYAIYYGLTHMGSCSIPTVIYLVGIGMVNSAWVMLSIGDTPEGSHRFPPAIERRASQQELACLPGRASHATLYRASAAVAAHPRGTTFENLSLDTVHSCESYLAYRSYWPAVS